MSSPSEAQSPSSSSTTSTTTTTTSATPTDAPTTTTENESWVFKFISSAVTPGIPTQLVQAVHVTCWLLFVVLGSMLAFGGSSVRTHALVLLGLTLCLYLSTIWLISLVTSPDSAVSDSGKKDIKPVDSAGVATKAKAKAKAKKGKNQQEKKKNQ
ncbi:hypothetical protein Pelo_432 [Pelomyxa schiedti]|nr:hypothetical protein Pelo_432 [Pelomyxa schiedti]